jgi:hypothetical protein
MRAPSIRAEHRNVDISIDAQAALALPSAPELPVAQSAETEFTGRRGAYRLINVDRERWLVYGKDAVQYVGMLVRRGVGFELHPMVPRGADVAGRDLAEVAAAL